MAAATMLLFLLISQIYVPLPRRGMVGGGLYEFVDEIRFYEVFAFSLVGVFAVARAVRLSTPSVWLLALAAALVNVALLMADVRMHAYSDFVERYVAERYGSPAAVWGHAAALQACGVGCACLAWRWERMRELARSPAVA